MDSRKDAEAFDFVVIGGGPGGYVAAIRASQLGASVVVVERETMGGVCLNWGCIPTKALLKTAEVRHTVENLSEYGLSLEGSIGVDMAKVMARSRHVASRLSGGIDHLMRKNGVKVISGTATLGRKQGAHREVAVDKNTTLLATHVIIATGARAAFPPHIKPDGVQVMTYREALQFDRPVTSVTIVGSGAIGAEFASFYNDMGASVTLIEMQKQILPVEDADIAASVRKQFEKRGMAILSGAAVSEIRKRPDGVTVSYEANGKQGTVESEIALLATGITGNIERLNLEAAGVTTERGHIVTNQAMETEAAGIYAIGDVTGAPWLAHKASHEGTICVEKIAGLPSVHAIGEGAVPGCTYCRPQVASVGMTEAAAIEAGHKVRVGRFPMLANGKAIAMGDDQGLIKTVFNDATGELLGAHMVGPEVTELIQGYAIARTLEATEAELIQTIFPHPTLSEAMHESVLDAYGRAIHF